MVKFDVQVKPNMMQLLRKAVQDFNRTVDG